MAGHSHFRRSALVRRAWLGAVFVLTSVVPVAAATTATSDPVGLIASDVPVGYSGMSFPLIATEVASGTLAGSNASTVTFLPGDPAIGPLLIAGQPYYVEILGGALLGERLEVDTTATKAAANNTVTLILGADSRSTVTVLDGSLAGVRAAVRRHVTLASFAALFTTALTGSDDPALADGVCLYESGDFVFYHLRADGSAWSRSGETADVRNLVIAPDVSIVLQLRSGTRRMVQVGAVRTTAFRKNLIEGYQPFASGFPVDLTPAQAGARVDDAPAAVRWVGSNAAAAADTLEIFSPAENGFIRYFLYGDGATWRRLGRTDDWAATAFLTPATMTMLRRVHPDATYRIAPPFSL